MNAYVVLILIISFLSCLAVYFKNRKLHFPVILYNALWSAIAFFSSFGISGVYIPNDEIYYIVLISMVSMNFSFFIFMPDKDLNKRVPNLNFREEYNHKKLVWIQLFLFIVLMIFLRRIVELLISGNFSAIRNMIYNAEVGSQYSLYSSGIETVLIQWIVNALILAIFIVTIILYLSGKIRFRVLFFSLILGLLYSLLTGGRMMLFRFGIIILIAVFLFRNNQTENILLKKVRLAIKSRKKVLIFFIIFVVILGLWFTFLRTSESNDGGIINSIIGYLINPLSYLSELVNGVRTTSMPLYGGGFIGGLLHPIDLILENLYGGNFLFPTDILIEETEYFIYIGGGQIYNALPTMLYAFYRDGGLITVGINSFLFGTILSFSYKNFKLKRDIRSSSIYILILYLVFMGILRWEPSLVQFWITLIAIIVLTTKFKFKF